MMPKIPELNDSTQYVGTPRMTDLFPMYDNTGKLTTFVSLQQIKDAILGVGINVGGTSPGDILTNDAEQEITNKTIAEAILADTVEVQVSDVEVSVATKLETIDTNVEAKESKTGASDKAYLLPMQFTAGATAEVISDTDILTELSIDAGEFAIASDSIVLQLRELDGGKYAVIPIDNSAITAVITPDMNDYLDQIEIDGLTESTAYSLSITFKVVARA